MLTAKDVMTSSVVAAQPDGTVGDVADLLVSHGISAVPVIDHGVLLGIVSEGDLFHRAEIGTATHRRSWWLRPFIDAAALAREYVRSHSVHVVDVMTRNVATVTETASIADIVSLLESSRIKRVPVLRNGQVVGIVSRADLVRALAVAAKAAPASASRDDESIRLEIIDALRSESWASGGNPNVAVTDGVVVFWGAYLSEPERKASHILAENIAGVRAIDDRRILLDATCGMV